MMKKERSQAAIQRSAKKVARKRKLANKIEKLELLEASGNRPTLANKPKQRISLEAYLKELEKIPHASEYELLSKFKLFTPKCIAQYQHKTCGTKFQTTPKNFENKKTLCPTCYHSEECSTIIDQLQ